MKDELLTHLLRRIAQVAVGPSTARGMGPAGTIQAARSFLAEKIDLSEVSRLTVEEFPLFLDRNTRELQLALPQPAQHWGAARKFLNIFLRDVLYTRWLCDGRSIDHLEESLEIPIDKHVALHLKGKPEGEFLPRWKTIIGLEKKESDQFQAVALAIAKERGFARIHLDLEYWRSDEALNGFKPSTPR